MRRAWQGLAPDRRLTASFHSMLVYGPMVATLVVMLQSVYSGGDLVVH